MSETQAAHEVFGLLSDGTRVDVLRAIAVAQRDQEDVDSGPAALTFSEIYDRVDVDNTSKLSYHLGELTGTFLWKRDEQYSLSHAGEHVVRFVLSGNYENPTSVDATPVSGRCLYCGGESLEANLNHQFWYVQCTSCDRPVTGLSVTPAQTRSAEGEELIRSVVGRHTVQVEHVRRGICPECAGSLSSEVRSLPTDAPPDSVSFVAVSWCDECLRGISLPLPYSVAYHPASVAFHWDHGVDVTSRGVWEFHDHLYEGRWTAEAVAADPEEYEVVLRRDGDELRIHLDRTGTVTGTERVRRRSGL